MEKLDDFKQRFATDDLCKAFLVQRRWPNGVTCPRCKRTEKVYALKARPFHWVCKNAGCGERTGYRFSVTAHTIFEDTKIPLVLWFKVAYLMLTAKKGMSALQIRRVVFGEDSGTDWHTVWYMCHRWRAAMRGDAFPLTGVVEVDETYIGGKDRNRHKNKKSRFVRKAAALQPAEMYRLKPVKPAIGFKKIGVIGAIARKGNVVCRVIGGQDAPTLKGFVNRMVDDKVSLVATDEKPDYQNVRPGLPHQSVNHSLGEYVRGESTPTTSNPSGH